MAYTIIADDCSSCSACEDTCSVAAISEGDGAYVINAEKCTDCGDCVESCPMDAIVKA